MNRKGQMMITPFLDRGSNQPIYSQIRDFIVNEIVEGRLNKNEALPSVRKFAQHLQLSCTSIENAYNQLLAEGYIMSRPQKGYFVEDIDFVVRTPKERNHELVDVAQVNLPQYDFTNGSTSSETFDFKIWKKHINYVLNYHVDTLFEATSVKGEPQLRETICSHFYRTRGVVADPSAIVIGSGVTPLLFMLMTLLNKSGIDHIAVEDPGFGKAYGVFRGGGFQVTPIKVGQNGMNLKALKESRGKVCYVSPSHQFPTGSIMTVKDRQNLLNWADKVGGYIIEDDYNFQLRYEGQPIPSMQSMDSKGKVIYLGSFSTVLAPGIRISFMVLPKQLKDLFEAQDNMFPQTASKLEQLALSRLIVSGDFEKHIRRIRVYYAKKQKMVLTYINTHFPKTVIPIKVKAGLQIILSLPEHFDEKVVEQIALSHQIRIEGLNQYRLNPKEQGKPSIVLSYRGIELNQLEEGLASLKNVLIKAGL